MCEHEFKELEWRLQHFDGGRRAWRAGGQIINGTRSLSTIFGSRVSLADISRGKFDFNIYFNRDEPDEVRVQSVFYLPDPGNPKQPLGGLLREYYRIVSAIEHKGVDDKDKRYVTCAFFLKVFKFATMPLSDAAHFYLKALNIEGRHNDADRCFVFNEEPYTQFLIWIEYLRMVNFLNQHYNYIFYFYYN